MDIKKYCIVCGTENFSPRSKFCSKKCEQRYYYLINKEKRQQYKKEYYEQHKEEYKERTKEWIKNNKEKHNEYAIKSYYKRKEMMKNEDNQCDQAI